VHDHDAWLAETLVELTDTVTDELQATTHGSKLTSALAELLAPAEAGVLVPAEKDEPAVLAATAAPVLDLITQEIELGSGPCLSCLRGGARMLNLGLAAVGDSWPAFERTASAAGFQAVTLLPMRRHRETVGAALILKSEPGAIRSTDLDIAQILVEAATVGIIQQRVRARETRRSEQLQRALDSRVLIEQAKGALAWRLGVLPEEAFATLRSHSRRNNRRLTEVAFDVVYRGLLPLDGEQTSRR
jgi:hypothetical protein